ncbi:carboxypeptidase-like regulatory domain-containing protein, partial [Singulisphaera rosea]
GEPGAGVTVAGQAARKLWSVRMTKTDASGHFRIDGLPKSENYRVDVRPIPGSPYLKGSSQTLSDTENLKPIDATFELPRGVVVQGRVTEEETGQVLPCEWVQYYPLAGNPHRGNLHGMAFAPDNGFRLTVPPGRGIVVVKLRAKPNRYPEAELTPADRATLADNGRGGLPPVVSLSLNNAYRLVDVPEGSGPVSIEMAVASTPVIEGELIIPGGKPTSGVKAMGLTIDPFSSATIAGSRFEVLGLRPGQERFVEFRQEILGLAGAVTVKSAGVKTTPLGVLTDLVVYALAIPPSIKQAFLADP